MENLRWILIIVGVLILVGIVLFANPNRPSKPARPRKGAGKRRSRQRVEPVLDTPADEESGGKDGMQQQAIAGLDVGKSDADTPDGDGGPQVTDADYTGAAQSKTNQTSTDARAPGDKGSGQSPPGPGDDQIVTLYVVAIQRHPISGVELLDAALKAGLKFGAQDIFHRLPQGSEKPMFSMANLTAPGHFDRTSWNLFETQGVTLFMTLPGPTSALVAWDAMLATAERLGELLKAEVQDKQRQPLTRQSIAHQREAMRNFDRQKH